MVWQLVNGEEMMICQLQEMVKHGAASSIMRTGRVYAIKRTKEALRQKQIDINNETKKCYYKKIILNQNKIRNDQITVEQFAEFLPTVSVEMNIQASGAEEYYVKDMSYEIEDGEIQYGIKYEFAPKNCADIFRVVKEVVSQTEINDANLKEVKMNLLPVEYYNYSIKVSDGSNVSYDTLRMFKYEALEAERDDFSKTKNQLGSKFLVDLLKDRLSDQDKLKIEKEYSHFFEALKEISDINDIINWQETSELKGAKKFFSHINILPNMPPMQSILSSVRLGYSEEELSMQGLGHRNLVLLFVLINSLLGKETDIALNVLTIEEPEAHLCINNTRLMVSFLKAFTDKNKTVQLFYSTHSTEFINKMNLKNVVVLHNGKAYSFADELEDEDFAYLAKNPNLDLFKLFFSKKCILFEGISEELLIRSYIDSKETLSDIEVLSFHKGFKKIMNIWKKVNEGSDNKLGIIRDYDNQSNAKKQHDKYNDDKEICVRTTEYYTLEPEIVNTGDNYKILKNKYGDVFGWNDMTDDQLTEAWKNAKATDMFTICKDLASGELEGFQMPKHIQDVIDFLSQESEEVL